MGKTAVVVTTVFHPSHALQTLAEGVIKNGWELIIIGDVSSPVDFVLEGSKYFDVKDQQQFGWRVPQLCPIRHYARKNIGYLIAIKNRNDVIVETDDDNIPLNEFWNQRQLAVATKSVTGCGWTNVYSLFTENNIWPRGFPLQEIQNIQSHVVASDAILERHCPVQQGLANDNPDVDAVYRMTQKLPVIFEKKGSYYLEKGSWSPFNSQNTSWFTEAFPLLYLPSYCTFRMTDIWRSFIAQRIMWECDWGLLYHGATVCQERNEHRLINDFEQEMPGYLQNDKIKTLLENLSLKRGVSHIGENMMRCYESLVRNKIISDARELDLLQAWLDDLEVIKKC